MKNPVSPFLMLVMATFLVSSCGSKPSEDKATPDPGQSKKVAAAAQKTTLDIIIGGPFVFVQGVNCASQSSPCVSAWAPKVQGHMGVIALANQAQFKKFDSGDYDFTSGIHRSDTTTLVTPVLNASVYSTSSKVQSLSSTPKKKPFATLLLPNPREIVSWNADPMTIASNGSPVATSPTDNLATLTILRYDYQQGDTLAIKSGANLFWTPQPIALGTERIIVIGFVPENPATNGDEHLHAKMAFQAATNMLGLKWKITFNAPPANFERNRPPDSNWPLPQDLLNFIDNTDTQDIKAEPSTLTKLEYEIRGKINDCKAPAILVTP